MLLNRRFFYLRCDTTSIPTLLLRVATSTPDRLLLSWNSSSFRTSYMLRHPSELLLTSILSTSSFDQPAAIQWPVSPTFPIDPVLRCGQSIQPEDSVLRHAAYAANPPPERYML
uniref:Hypothetical membrane-anchored protein n=1 Tax=Aedes aegypti TaxID=7159 RepID=Q1HR48_AEDAE|nr:hypothetical membrane-anchored protein [Aedes aegypti]